MLLILIVIVVICVLRRRAGGGDASEQNNNNNNNNINNNNNNSDPGKSLISVRFISQRMYLALVAVSNHYQSIPRSNEVTPNEYRELSVLSSQYDELQLKQASD